MRLFPKGFTSNLRGITGEFLTGIWNGMGTDPSKGTRKKSKVRRRRRNAK